MGKAAPDGGSPGEGALRTFALMFITPAHHGLTLASMYGTVVAERPRLLEARAQRRPRHRFLMAALAVALAGGFAILGATADDPPEAPANGRPAVATELDVSGVPTWWQP